MGRDPVEAGVVTLAIAKTAYANAGELDLQRIQL